MMTGASTLIGEQGWKLRVGMLALLVGTVIFFFLPQYFAINFDNGHIVPGQLVATLFFLVGMIWCSLAIYCPRCHLKLFWYAIKNKPLSSWSMWLLTASTCPRCGYIAQRVKRSSPENESS
jgi:hypothetical protein